MRRFCFLIDPPRGLRAKKDSTVALARATAAAGIEVFLATIADLSQRAEGVFARARAAAISDDDENWFEWKEQSAPAPLESFDAVWMRKEPPVDSTFAAAARMLADAEARGARIFNSPRALLGENEKTSIFRHSRWIAPTLVSSDAAQIAAFHREHGGAIIKPLDGMGGRGVFHSPADDRNLPVILETLGCGARALMAQKFIPQARDGDLRVFVIAGAVAPQCLARVPSADDHRGNLAAGARAEGRPLPARARQIAEDLAPRLARSGILFAGLDILGDYLTEVNITCPTGLRETRDQTGFDGAQAIVAATVAAIEAAPAIESVPARE